MEEVNETTTPSPEVEGVLIKPEPVEQPEEVSQQDTPQTEEDSNNPITEEQGNEADLGNEGEQDKEENESTSIDQAESSTTEQTQSEEEESEVVPSNEEGLRNRKKNEPSSTTTEDPEEEKEKDRLESGNGKLVGVTDKGERFYLPKTKNPLTMKPIAEWSTIEWIKNASLLNVLFLFFGLPRWFFIAIFVFWRLAYNVGLGYLLHIQSKEKTLTKWMSEIKPGHPYYPIVKQILELGMDKDYDYDKFPDAFNAWVAYRYVVDIVLANDLVCYFVFCLACWEWPESFTFTLVICYIVGLGLNFFTLWAKTDAYRVVKDFAWYWGDFFFLVDQRLTFDRVFSISPHPMYTIGYSFFYGASLITQSHTVLYVSLFGHFCQLAFLSFVENPHIEKTYPGIVEDRTERNRILYDAQTGYFRRDLIVFKNFDPFRSSDLFVCVIVFYAILLCFLDLPAWFFIGHAIFWRCIHSFGLGWILKQQSERNLWTDHFTKHGYTKQFAFENWKKIYNMSLVLTYVSFLMCCWKYFSFDYDFYGQMLVKQTVGLVLIAVNIWSSVSVFEVLGEFGWFYGDFFIDEVPSALYYSGIYRFVNNPDSVTGFAAYYGLALFTNSWTLFGLALLAQGINQIFIRNVEEPHMKKLYGNQVRSTSGFQQALNQIIDEAVEQSPHLKTLKDSATEIEAKAKARANKIKEIVKTKVKTTLEGSTKGRFPC